MADTAVADPIADVSPSSDALELHLDSMFADEVEEETPATQEQEVVEEVAAAEDEGTESQTEQGTNDSADNTTAEQAPDKEPETVEEYKARLEAVEAAHQAEIAKMRTSIDKQGNRFMGVTEQVKQLQAQLDAVQAQRKTLGERPDFLEDNEGATIHTMKSAQLDETAKRLASQISSKQSSAQRVEVEQAAAAKFAPEHADMVDDLVALWKKDVPDYQGTADEFKAAMYDQIPASTIISMVKRHKAEQRAEAAEAKVQELMDKFTKAGKAKPRLVTAGSGQATDAIQEDDDDDILSFLRAPQGYAR